MDVDSDNEIDSKDHKKLLDNVLNLNSRQYINKPSRTEPTAQISEYNLIKSLGDDKDDVQLYNLTKSLKNRAVDVELRKKVKKTEAKSKTLAKPLEKPQAARIKRSTAYESTKEHLDRWEPVVTSNRVSTNLSFPLKDINLNYKEARDFSSNWVLKSNLEKELEKLEPKMETIEVETETSFPLTLKEMMAKRKEMAKLRRFQSYKEIKVRWQNKIKSKKFRRIARKEKIKEQMKEFDLLQKTNPEEALKKLDEIEKARAEERASLRHKSTGKWARNQQIRAKYDKESRKVLSEQLSISKDLLQKQQINQSSESEDDDSDNANSQNVNSKNGENIWLNEIKPSKEVEEFVSGYRKYWESQNLKKSEENIENIQTPTEIINSECSVQNDDTVNIVDNKLNKLPSNTEKLTTQDNPDSIKIGKKRKIKNSRPAKMENKRNKQKRQKVKSKTQFEIDTASETWEVTSLNNENDTIIDDIFDNIEYKVKDKVDKKLKRVESKLKNNLELSQKTSKSKVQKNDVKMKSVEKKSKESPLIAEDNRSVQNVELPKSNGNTSNENASKSLESLKTIFESQYSSKSSNKVNKNNFEQETYKIKKTIALNTAIPDILSYEDNEESTSTGGLIMEAFEDNDIVEEFALEKKGDIEGDRPKDIDLTLPGWGSWGGKDIPITKKRRKRFIIKAPKKFPRKDMNKGHLIINESANDNVKPHLVSEVPFPFKAVKDFEASLRAPIGNTFVPETAFRRNIKPALMTRMGSIIEPITEDVLLHKQKKK